MRLKHRLPLGTKVSFEGDAQIYRVASYQDVLGPCEPDCTSDHDCYEEAYMTVSKESWTAFPLSKLKHVFDHPNGHSGRDATEAERTPE